MAYTLHIERNEPITLSSWKEAVSKTANIKLYEQATINSTNPKTGEIISIKSNPGDVSVLLKTNGFLGFGKKSSWENCIYFSNGRGTFNAVKDIESPKNPLHRAAVALANELSAQILGDEGEILSLIHI